MYFDGVASLQKGSEPRTILQGKAEIRLVFFTLNYSVLWFSYYLTKPCTNNEAEYQVLIVRLEMFISLSISNLDINSDSQLLINQIVKSYKILELMLMKYYKYIMALLDKSLRSLFINYLGMRMMWLML